MEAVSEPTIEYDPEEDYLDFNGFEVHAQMLGYPDKALTIYTFTSQRGGQGNGELALRWLKHRCPHIRVSDPGHPSTSPDAFGFWSRMCEKGLVDEMEDTHGRPIFKDGHWLPHEDGRAIRPQTP